MVIETTNTFGDRIQVVGDITLNLEYWDCDCRDNYIHSISQNECNICNALQDENPSSREDEVSLQPLQEDIL